MDDCINMQAVDELVALSTYSELNSQSLTWSIGCPIENFLCSI